MSIANPYAQVLANRVRANAIKDIEADLKLIGAAAHTYTTDSISLDALLDLQYRVARLARDA